MFSINTIFISAASGVLPAVFWLWFWLKEDRLHPEPKRRIIAVFLAGMISVLLVLPLERFIFSQSFEAITFMTIFLWAGLEEIFKYLSAYFTALRRKEMDEPIDAVIYMITAALGFSALENALFLSRLIDVGYFAQSVITGNSRFLGATLLHTASSAAIGVMLGLSYYKNPLVKKIFLFTGISISIVLHMAYNLLIIKLEKNIFFVFAGVWLLIVLLLVLIEKVKAVRRTN
jgi:RsiW-degrading membrane proteinase PrsW (M82 family)